MQVYSRKVGESTASFRPTLEFAIKTQGEIEAAICEGIARFEHE